MLLGDGVLAVFTSARQTNRGHPRLRQSGRQGVPPPTPGRHAGDVIREENNVYGGAVNIASRISGLSAPREVLVSETVRSLARTSAGVSFEDRGRRKLKGIGGDDEGVGCAAPLSNFPQPRQIVGHVSKVGGRH